MKAEVKKTLILLIPGFPADEWDTTCLPPQQAFILALRKKYSNLNIVVIAFQYPFKSNRYEWKGITVIPLNGRNKGNVYRLNTWIRAWRELRQLRKTSQVMGLLSFWCTDCALVGKWFAKFNRLKHYCWILGQDARKENRFIKFINPKPTELIALSSFLEKEFQANHFIKPFLVIPNAIDPQSFFTISGERSIDVIGIGSLIPLKQYEVFISVLKKVVEQLPSLKAIICGEGPEFSSLKRLIQESGLKKNVQLVGEKTHDEILLLLQLSKVLLHPSSYEGYSTVCLEALYAGTHVISFRSPDDRKIEHWHVVESIEEMEKKVLAVLSDPAIDHKRVLLHTVEESANAIVDLFSGDQTVAADARVEG